MAYRAFFALNCNRQGHFKKSQYEFKTPVIDAEMEFEHKIFNLYHKERKRERWNAFMSKNESMKNLIFFS